MGAIFKKPKAPPPDPQIAISQKKQEERIAVQEQKADVEEKQELQRTQAETRARRKGGARRGGGSAMRLLLSPDRQNAQLGLKDTLG